VATQPRFAKIFPSGAGSFTPARLKVDQPKEVWREATLLASLEAGEGQFRPLHPRGGGRSEEAPGVEGRRIAAVGEAGWFVEARLSGPRPSSLGM
jgi:hypothetical protein